MRFMESDEVLESWKTLFSLLLKNYNYSLEVELDKRTVC